MKTTPSREILKSVSVLYVEDDLDIQRQLARFLSKTVGTLYTAENGREGLEVYKKYKPDILITDIRMPVMSGLEMAKQVRDMDQDIPIIVTTAFNEQEYFLGAIDVQISKYVIKPTDPFLLLDALGSIAITLVDKKEKDLNNRYIRFILDSQPNFMIAANKYKIEYINKTFLKYLGYSTLEEFYASGSKLEDFIDNIKGISFSTDDRSRWLQKVIDSPDRDLLVYFRDKENTEIYLLACSKFPELDKYFFTFTNITKIEEEKRLFEKQAITDILTGVFNRKKLIDTLAAEVNRNMRYNTPLSLIMFDIDHFKEINDKYGHYTGDEILKNISRIVSENIRQSDTLARWGGDEFLILTPETDLNSAKMLADKINSNIKKFKFGVGEKVTGSFGVAQIKKEDDIDSFVKRVDDALYRAKEEGRARVAF